MADETETNLQFHSYKEYEEEKNTVRTDLNVGHVKLLLSTDLLQHGLIVMGPKDE